MTRLTDEALVDLKSVDAWGSLTAITPQQQIAMAQELLIRRADERRLGDLLLQALRRDEEN